MKTLKILLTLSFICATFAFTSCLKKGEDDPLISLRTRNNRLIGEWKLVSMESESIYNYTYSNGQYQNGNGNSITSKFDGTTLTIIYESYNTYNGVTTYYDTSYAYIYSRNMNINKYGTYTIDESRTKTFPAPSSTETDTYSDMWSCCDSKKNEIQLILWNTSENMIYKVIKLSNKELVLEYDWSGQGSGQIPNTSSEKGKWVFEKK